MEQQIPKTIEKIINMILKLEPQEFIGICKILGVKIYDEVVSVEPEDGSAPSTENESGSHVEVRPAEILFGEVLEKLTNLNRTQRRNLTRLLKPAVKGR